jgi:hypothetical protein
METITLTLTELDRLKAIQKNLKGMKVLPISQQSYLYSILSLFPTSEEMLLRCIGNATGFQVNLWDTKRLEAHLIDWCRLFAGVPGYDHSTNFCIVGPERADLLRRNVIVVSNFSPSMSYHLSQSGNPCEVHLHDDGTASFWLPTFDLAERYPDMDFFRGTWQEAYQLLAETIRAGWPMEEFPQQLKQLSVEC